MTTLAEQMEELSKAFKKLANVKGRWMKNVWWESALLASLIMIIGSLVLMVIWSVPPSSPTHPLPSTETPLQRTIYPDMHQDYP